MYEYYDIVKLLLKHGADINNYERDMLLIFSIIHENGPIIKIIKLLLANGADPNIAYKNGSYPLHFAAQNGYYEVVKLLLQYGAKVNEPGYKGITPILFAFVYTDRGPHVDVINLLIEHWAESDIKILLHNIL
jgi:ankyrin repeat protein